MDGAWFLLLLGMVLLVGGSCLIQHLRTQSRLAREALEAAKAKEAWDARFKYLSQKFRSEDIARAIMSEKIWIGMTDEQLRESWGEPIDIDRTVYKSNTKEVWKYQQLGKNRFRERIYVENGEVVGRKESHQ
jgi:hypothetical protein